MLRENYQFSLVAIYQFFEIVMNKTQLTKELECPVCFQIPRNSPIYQCVNGHLICSVCKEKIKDICPQVLNQGVLIHRYSL